MTTYLESATTNTTCAIRQNFNCIEKNISTLVEASDPSFALGKSTWILITGAPRPSGALH